MLYRSSFNQAASLTGIRATREPNEVLWYLSYHEWSVRYMIVWYGSQQVSIQVSGSSKNLSLDSKFQWHAMCFCWWTSSMSNSKAIDWLTILALSWSLSFFWYWAITSSSPSITAVTLGIDCVWVAMWSAAKTGTNPIRYCSFQNRYEHIHAFMKIVLKYNSAYILYDKRQLT